MKKLFIVLSASLLLAACGGKSGSSSADSAATSTAATGSTGTAATASTGSTSAATGPDLIAKSDCSTCHKEQEKLVGPAFADVAAKYQSGGDAIVDTLAHKIINGGSGHWGNIPMAAHPGLSVDDAKTIVKYILTIKKK